MSLRIQDAGTLRTIKRLRIQQGGILRDIRRLRVMHDGVLRTVATFAEQLTASANPTQVNGRENSTKPVTVFTNETTAIPTGGRAPFTYSWTQTSGPVATITAPNMATTQFSTAVGPNSTASAVFICTITDAVGQSASVEVKANFSNFDEGGISA